MSVIGNMFLSVAKIFAQSSGSNLDIVIKENDVKFKFTKKKSDDKRIYENHYESAEFYIEDSANPVKLDWENKEWQKHNTVHVFDDFITTKYYKSFMQQESITRMFNISGPQQDLIIKLLYATLAGIAVLGVLLMALYAA